MLASRAAATTLLTVCAVTALAGCSSSPHHTPVRTRASHRAHVPTSPTRTRHRLRVDPLTGRGPVPRGPVIAAKIDNTAAGRPQLGLNAADLVYVTQVEGGLTRMIALYASRRPSVVGPIRSARRDDPELLQQYGSIALASSGGAAGELAAVHHSRLVDASALVHPDAYRRVGGRVAPENLMLNVARLAKDAHKAEGVRPLGLRFGSRVPAGGRTVRRLTAMVGGSAITFSWDRHAGRWIMPNAGGPPVATRNVVVQFCRVHADRHDIDTAGNPAAFTVSVGSGRAVIFRNGRMFSGRWSRRSLGAPTRYLSRSGRPIPLAPGGEWVLLSRRGSALGTR